MTVSTIYSQTLNTDHGGWGTWTKVQSFTADSLTLPAGTIANVRVTFEAGSAEGLQISSAYIGHAAGSGDAYDFAATPVQLLFSGAGDKLIGSGGTALTDWAAFTYDKTSALLVAIYVTTSTDTVRKATGLAAGLQQYYFSGSEAAAVDKTAGYFNLAQENHAINKMEAEVLDSAGFFF